jgi:hypothetical protein
MDLEQLFQTLKNEYNSGRFFMEGNRIGWIYKTNGVSTAEEAEDRWLSFLGAKLTVQSVIENLNYKMVEKFEINNRIGFFIVEGNNKSINVENNSKQKSIFSGLFN